MLASMRTVARSVAFATRVAAGTRVRALGTAQPTVADVTFVFHCVAHVFESVGGFAKYVPNEYTWYGR